MSPLSSDSQSMAWRPGKSTCSGWSVSAEQETAATPLKPNPSSSNQPFVSARNNGQEICQRTAQSAKFPKCFLTLWQAEQLMAPPVEVHFKLWSVDYVTLIDELMHLLFCELPNTNRLKNTDKSMLHLTFTIFLPWLWFPASLLLNLTGWRLTCCSIWPQKSGMHL